MTGGGSEAPGSALHIVDTILKRACWRGVGVRVEMRRESEANERLVTKRPGKQAGTHINFAKPFAHNFAWQLRYFTHESINLRAIRNGGGSILELRLRQQLIDSTRACSPSPLSHLIAITINTLQFSVYANET